MHQSFLLAKMITQILFSLLIISFSSVHSSLFPKIPKEPIPSTSLKTGTFYKVTTSNTDTKHLTWSLSTHPNLGHRYIISDNNPSSHRLYKKGALNYLQDHWFFIPAKGYPGWYHLANRGIPGEYAGWSSQTNGEILGQEIYHLILNPRYSIENPKEEYLFKPVQDGLRFVLKTKALPNAFITVFNKEEIQNSSRFYLSLYNEEDPNYRNVHLKGGAWFIYTLFKFEAVDDQPILSASISKIQITGSLEAQNDRGLSTLFSEELAPKLVIINNGTSSLSKDYSAHKEISEHVIIQPPLVFSNIPKISVEDSVVDLVEIEDNPAIQILTTPSFQKHLISGFSSLQDILSKPTWNYMKIREFNATQTIEVAHCTEYHVIGRVNIQKNFPINYLVDFKLTGEIDGKQISAFQLRDEHLYKIGREDDTYNQIDVEFLEILDEYTILVQAKSKMWVTFAKAFEIIGKQFPINGCVQNQAYN